MIEHNARGARIQTHRDNLIDVALLSVTQIDVEKKILNERDYSATLDRINNLQFTKRVRTTSHVLTKIETESESGVISF